MPDALTFLSAQWAILGVLVVVGLFLIWRRLNALDEKLAAVVGGGGAVCPRYAAEAGAAPAPGVQVYDDEDDVEDEDEGESADAALMRAIFEQGMPIEGGGGGATIMMFTDAAPAAPAPPEVTISEADSERPSKTQLRKLSVDALKEQLAAKGLPTDGTKAALVQRLADAAAEE